MDTIKQLQRNCLGAGLTLALVGATIAPASAQVIIINGVRQHPTTTRYIYGRPTRTQIYVNPSSRYRHWDNNYRHHPRTTIYSYPSYPQTIVNPVLTYPNVVHPMFRNSTQRNPVFDNRFQNRQYHQPYRQYNQRYRGRSRGVVIQGY
jgi:hypothetical protein